MWTRKSFKSNGGKDDTQAQSSRRREGSRPRSDSKTSSSMRKKSSSSRGDDRDRGIDPISTGYTSTPQNTYAYTAEPSIASSYATAAMIPTDYQIISPELIRGNSFPDQTSSTKYHRDDNTYEEQYNGKERRSDPSGSKEQSKRSKGSGDPYEDKRERKERREKRRDSERENGRGMSRSDSYPQSTSRGLGDFSAQVHGSGFTQFPGQYDGGFTAGPGARPQQHEPLSSHVPDQFPGQFPSESSRPYRPPLAKNEGGPGLASEYYGDSGQSVQDQPGVRPQPPPLIIGAEPHLQPASAVEAPPPEPSSLGQMGAAASFYNNTEDFGPTSASTRPMQPSSLNQTLPGTFPAAAPLAGAVAAGMMASNVTFGQSNSQYSEQTSYHSRPSTSAPSIAPSNNTYYSTSTNVNPIVGAAGAAAAGTAAGYMLGHQSSSSGQVSQAPMMSGALNSSYQSSYQSSYENRPPISAPPANAQQSSSSINPVLGTVGAAAAGATAGYLLGNHSSSLNKPPTQSSINGSFQGRLSDQRPPRPQSYHQDTQSFVGNVQGSYNNGGSQANGAPHHSSNAPLYAAGLAGAAGLTAASMHNGRHSPPHDSQSFSHGSMAQQHHEKYHQRQGPLDRFVDFWRDPYAVGQYENYTEYIGVCRYCFSPDSSARDAPRKHHYGRRKSSYERLNAASRVGKDYRRYSSSSDSDRERKNKNNSWLAAGLGAYGLGKVGKSLFAANHGFDDTYSVQSGKPVRSSSKERKSYSQTGFAHMPGSYPVPERGHAVTGITIDGKDSRGNSNYPRLAESHSKTRRSQSRSRDRVSAITGAAIGAAAGGSVLASTMKRHSRSRERRDDHHPHHPQVDYVEVRRDGQREHGHSTQHQDQLVEVRRREDRGSHGHSISPNRRKKTKKSKGFFSFSNSSSSSADTSLAFGGELVRQKSKKELRSRKKSNDKTDAAILGLGAAAAALALQQGHQNGKGKQRADAPGLTNPNHIYTVDGRKDSHGRYGHHHGPDDDGWESASDDDHSSVDSMLAYGMSGRSSRESLRSDQSGTEKWGWRWGGESKKSKKREHHDSSGPILGAAATAAMGGAVAAEGVHRYDERNHSIGIDANLPPMQHVFPHSTSDPTTFDAARHSSTISPSQPLTTVRPSPLPLQQPQPISQVSTSVLKSMAPFDHSYSAPTGSVIYNQPPYLPQATSPGTLPFGAPPSGHDAMPGSFPLPSSALPYETQPVIKEIAPRRRDSSPPDLSKVNRDASRISTGIEIPPSVRFNLTKEDKDRERREKKRRKKEEKARRAEADRLEQLQQAEMAAADRAVKTMSQTTVSPPRRVLDKYESPPRQVSDEREQRSERRSRSDSHPTAVNQPSSWVAPAIAGAAGAAVGAAIIHEIEPKRKDRPVTDHDDGYEDMEKPRDYHHDGKYQEVYQRVIQDIQEPETLSREELSKEERRVKRHQERVAREVARRISRTPSPVHEKYSDFFQLPPGTSEAAKEAEEEKKALGVPDADNEISRFRVVPRVLMMEAARNGPKNVYNAQGELMDSDRMMPWRVAPMLNLVEPTPPGSIAGSLRGDASPVIQPKAQPEIVSVAEFEEPTKEAPKPRSTSKVRFGDNDMQEYEVITPESHREEFIESNYKPLKRTYVEESGKTVARSPSPEEYASNDQTRQEHMPGEYGDDIDFTATVAAGLEDSGFPSSIVVDDPSFRRRESPPGSDSERPSSDKRDVISVYQTPLSETVTDLGSDSRRAKDGSEAKAPNVMDFLVEEPAEHMVEIKPKGDAKSKDTSKKRSLREVIGLVGAAGAAGVLSSGISSSPPKKSAEGHTVTLESGRNNSRESQQDPMTSPHPRQLKREDSDQYYRTTEYPAPEVSATAEDFYDAPDSLGSRLDDTPDTPKSIPDDISGTLAARPEGIPLPIGDDYELEEHNLNVDSTIDASEARQMRDLGEHDIANALQRKDVVPEEMYEEPSKLRKKSKRRSTTDLDDLASVVSAPTVINRSPEPSGEYKSESRKQRKGGLFGGIFSKSSEDVSAKSSGKGKSKTDDFYDYEEPAKTGKKPKERRSTGQENCLVGLTFVFTGNLPNLDREEGQQLVKKYGGKVSTYPSSKTTYVVLGRDAGRKKLDTINQLSLKTIDEDGLFRLIETMPAKGASGKAEDDFDDDVQSRASEPVIGTGYEQVSKKGKRGKEPRSTRDEYYDDDAYSRASEPAPTVGYEDSGKRSKKSKDRKASRNDYDDDALSRASEPVPTIPGLDDAEDDVKSRKKRSKDEKRKSRKDSEANGEPGTVTQELPAKVHLPTFPAASFATGFEGKSLTETGEAQNGSSDETVIVDRASQIRDKSLTRNLDQDQSFLGERRERKKPPDEEYGDPGTENRNSLQRSRDVEAALQALTQRRPTTPESDGSQREVQSTPRRRRRVSMLQSSDSPTAPSTPSPTAIPISFRLGARPSSMQLARSSPNTPTLASTQPDTPRARNARPKSGEIRRSTEIRPLFLVEKHSVRQEPALEERYPSLPSSHSTSRASSVHDGGDEQDEVDRLVDHEHRKGSYHGRSLDIDVGHFSEAELLDSQQATPTATTFREAGESVAQEPESSYRRDRRFSQGDTEKDISATATPRRRSSRDERERRRSESFLRNVAWDKLAGGAAALEALRYINTPSTRLHEEESSAEEGAKELYAHQPPLKSQESLGQLPKGPDFSAESFDTFDEGRVPHEGAEKTNVSRAAVATELPVMHVSNQPTNSAGASPTAEMLPQVIESLPEKQFTPHSLEQNKRDRMGKEEPEAESLGKHTESKAPWFDENKSFGPEATIQHVSPNRDLSPTGLNDVLTRISQPSELLAGQESARTVTEPNQVPTLSKDMSTTAVVATMAAAAGVVALDDLHSDKAVIAEAPVQEEYQPFEFSNFKKGKKRSKRAKAEDWETDIPGSSRASDLNVVNDETAGPSLSQDIPVAEPLEEVTLSKKKGKGEKRSSIAAAQPEAISQEVLSREALPQEADLPTYSLETITETPPEFTASTKRGKKGKKGKREQISFDDFEKTVPTFEEQPREIVPFERPLSPRLLALPESDDLDLGDVSERALSSECGVVEHGELPLTNEEPADAREAQSVPAESHVSVPSVLEEHTLHAQKLSPLSLALPEDADLDLEEIVESPLPSQHAESHILVPTVIDESMFPILEPRVPGESDLKRHNAPLDEATDKLPALDPTSHVGAEVVETKETPLDTPVYVPASDVLVEEVATPTPQESIPNVQGDDYFGFASAKKGKKGKKGRKNQTSTPLGEPATPAEELTAPLNDPEVLSGCEVEPVESSAELQTHEVVADEWAPLTGKKKGKKGKRSQAITPYMNVVEETSTGPTDLPDSEIAGIERHATPVTLEEKDLHCGAPATRDIQPEELAPEETTSSSNKKKGKKGKRQSIPFEDATIAEEISPFASVHEPETGRDLNLASATYDAQAQEAVEDSWAPSSSKKKGKKGKKQSFILFDDSTSVAEDIQTPLETPQIEVGQDLESSIAAEGVQEPEVDELASTSSKKEGKKNRKGLRTAEEPTGELDVTTIPVRALQSDTSQDLESAPLSEAVEVQEAETPAKEADVAEWDLPISKKRGKKGKKGKPVALDLGEPINESVQEADKQLNIQSIKPESEHSDLAVETVQLSPTQLAPNDTLQPSITSESQENLTMIDQAASNSASLDPMSSNMPETDTSNTVETTELPTPSDERDPASKTKGKKGKKGRRTSSKAESPVVDRRQSTDDWMDAALDEPARFEEPKSAFEGTNNVTVEEPEALPEVISDGAREIKETQEIGPDRPLTPGTDDHHPVPAYHEDAEEEALPEIISDGARAVKEGPLFDYQRPVTPDASDSSMIFETPSRYPNEPIQEASERSFTRSMSGTSESTHDSFHDVEEEQEQETPRLRPMLPLYTLHDIDVPSQSTPLAMAFDARDIALPLDEPRDFDGDAWHEVLGQTVETDLDRELTGPGGLQRIVTLEGSEGDLTADGREGGGLGQDTDRAAMPEGAKEDGAHLPAHVLHKVDELLQGSSGEQVGSVVTPPLDSEVVSETPVGMGFTEVSRATEEYGKEKYTENEPVMEEPTIIEATVEETTQAEPTTTESIITESSSDTNAKLLTPEEPVQGVSSVIEPLDHAEASSQLQFSEHTPSLGEVSIPMEQAETSSFNKSKEDQEKSGRTATLDWTGEEEAPQTSESSREAPFEEIAFTPGLNHPPLEHFASTASLGEPLGSKDILPTESFVYEPVAQETLSTSRGEIPMEAEELSPFGLKKSKKDKRKSNRTRTFDWDEQPEASDTLDESSKDTLGDVVTQTLPTASAEEEKLVDPRDVLSEQPILAKEAVISQEQPVPAPLEVKPSEEPAPEEFSSFSSKKSKKDKKKAKKAQAFDWNELDVSSSGQATPGTQSLEASAVLLEPKREDPSEILAPIDAVVEQGDGFQKVIPAIEELPMPEEESTFGVKKSKKDKKRSKRAQSLELYDEPEPVAENATALEIASGKKSSDVNEALPAEQVLEQEPSLLPEDSTVASAEPLAVLEESTFSHKRSKKDKKSKRTQAFDPSDEPDLTSSGLLTPDISKEVEQPIASENFTIDRSKLPEEKALAEYDDDYSSSKKSKKDKKKSRRAQTLESNDERDLASSELLAPDVSKEVEQTITSENPGIDQSNPLEEEPQARIDKDISTSRKAKKDKKAKKPKTLNWVDEPQADDTPISVAKEESEPPIALTPDNTVRQAFTDESIALKSLDTDIPTVPLEVPKEEQPKEAAPVLEEFGSFGTKKSNKDKKKAKRTQTSDWTEEPEATLTVLKTSEAQQFLDSSAPPEEPQKPEPTPSTAEDAAEEGFSFTTKKKGKKDRKKSKQAEDFAWTDENTKAIPEEPSVAGNTYSQLQPLETQEPISQLEAIKIPKDPIEIECSESKRVEAFDEELHARKFSNEKQQLASEPEVLLPGEVTQEITPAHAKEPDIKTTTKPISLPDYDKEELRSESQDRGLPRLEDPSIAGSPSMEIINDVPVEEPVPVALHDLNDSQLPSQSHEQSSEQSVTEHGEEILHMPSQDETTTKLLRKASSTGYLPVPVHDEDEPIPPPKTLQQSLEQPASEHGYREELVREPFKEVAGPVADNVPAVERVSVVHDNMDPSLPLQSREIPSEHLVTRDLEGVQKAPSEEMIINAPLSEESSIARQDATPCESLPEVTTPIDEPSEFSLKKSKKDKKKSKKAQLAAWDEVAEASIVEDPTSQDTTQSIPDEQPNLSNQVAEEVIQNKSAHELASDPYDEGAFDKPQDVVPLLEEPQQPPVSLEVQPEPATPLEEPLEYGLKKSKKDKKKGKKVQSAAWDEVVEAAPAIDVVPTHEAQASGDTAALVTEPNTGHNITEESVQGSQELAAHLDKPSEFSLKKSRKDKKKSKKAQALEWEDSPQAEVSATANISTHEEAALPEPSPSTYQKIEPSTIVSEGKVFEEPQETTRALEEVDEPSEFSLKKSKKDKKKSKKTQAFEWDDTPPVEVPAPADALIPEDPQLDQPSHVPEPTAEPSATVGGERALEEPQEAMRPLEAVAEPSESSLKKSKKDKKKSKKAQTVSWDETPETPLVEASPLPSQPIDEPSTFSEEGLEQRGIPADEQPDGSRVDARELELTSSKKSKRDKKKAKKVQEFGWTDEAAAGSRGVEPLDGELPQEKIKEAAQSFEAPVAESSRVDPLDEEPARELSKDTAQPIEVTTADIDQASDEPLETELFTSKKSKKDKKARKRNTVDWNNELPAGTPETVPTPLPIADEATPLETTQVSYDASVPEDFEASTSKKGKKGKKSKRAQEGEWEEQSQEPKAPEIETEQRGNVSAENDVQASIAELLEKAVPEPEELDYFSVKTRKDKKKSKPTTWDEPTQEVEPLKEIYDVPENGALPSGIPEDTPALTPLPEEAEAGFSTAKKSKRDKKREQKAQEEVWEEPANEPEFQRDGDDMIMPMAVETREDEEIARFLPSSREEKDERREDDMVMPLVNEEIGDGAVSQETKHEKDVDDMIMPQPMEGDLNDEPAATIFSDEPQYLPTKKSKKDKRKKVGDESWNEPAEGRAEGVEEMTEVSREVDTPVAEIAQSSVATPTEETEYVSSKKSRKDKKKSKKHAVSWDDPIEEGANVKADEAIEDVKAEEVDLTTAILHELGLEKVEIPENPVDEVVDQPKGADSVPRDFEPEARREGATSTASAEDLEFFPKKSKKDRKGSKKTQIDQWEEPVLEREPVIHRLMTPIPEIVIEETETPTSAPLYDDSERLAPREEIQKDNEEAQVWVNPDKPTQEEAVSESGERGLQEATLHPNIDEDKPEPGVVPNLHEHVGYHEQSPAIEVPERSTLALVENNIVDPPRSHGYDLDEPLQSRESVAKDDFAGFTSTKKRKKPKRMETFDAEANEAREILEEQHVERPSSQHARDVSFQETPGSGQLVRADESQPPLSEVAALLPPIRKRSKKSRHLAGIQYTSENQSMQEEAKRDSLKPESGSGSVIPQGDFFHSMGPIKATHEASDEQIGEREPYAYPHHEPLNPHTFPVEQEGQERPLEDPSMYPGTLSRDVDYPRPITPPEEIELARKKSKKGKKREKVSEKASEEVEPIQRDEIFEERHIQPEHIKPDNVHDTTTTIEEAVKQLPEEQIYDRELTGNDGRDQPLELPSKKSKKSRKSRNRSSEPIEDEPTFNPKPGVAASIAAGVALFEGLQRGKSVKNKKDRKSSTAVDWDGLNPEEHLAGKVKNRRESIEKGARPEDLARSDVETPRSQSRKTRLAAEGQLPAQEYRDSGVHFDSPVLQEQSPVTRDSIRDSGYQGVEDSPPIESVPQSQGRELHSDAVQDAEHAQTRHLQVGEKEQSDRSYRSSIAESSDNPLNISIEVDPSYDISVSRPVGDGRHERRRSKHEARAIQDQLHGDSHQLDRGALHDPVLVQSEILQEPSVEHPSQVHSTSRDRSSGLFDSSPSTRDHGPTYDGHYQQSTIHQDDVLRETSRDVPIEQARLASPPMEERPTGQSTDEPAKVAQGSLFGGPVGINSDQVLSPPRTPIESASSRRRRLNTITEHSPEETIHHKHPRESSDVVMSEPAVKSVRRSSTPKTFAQHRVRSPLGASQLASVAAAVGITEALSTDKIIAGMSWPSVDEDTQSVDLDQIAKQSRDTSRNSSGQHDDPSILPVKSKGGRRSLSGASAASGDSIRAYIQSPDQPRSMSGTPPLRRTDRSVSRDLRAANKRESAKKQAKPYDDVSEREFLPDTAIASSSTYDPVKDKGKSRSQDMADVYVSI